MGGVAAISLVIAIGFFLRRRRREASVVNAPVIGASEPPMNEIQQPLTIEDGYTVSSTGVPGTIGSPMPGTPAVLVKIYVRVSCPICHCTSMCS